MWVKFVCLKTWQCSSIFAGRCTYVYHFIEYIFHEASRHCLLGYARFDPLNEHPRWSLFCVYPWIFQYIIVTLPKCTYMSVFIENNLVSNHCIANWCNIFILLRNYWRSIIIFYYPLEIFLQNLILYTIIFFWKLV